MNSIYLFAVLTVLGYCICFYYINNLKKQLSALKTDLQNVKVEMVRNNSFMDEQFKLNKHMVAGIQSLVETDKLINYLNAHSGAIAKA